jgi:hypothetical protein
LEERVTCLLPHRGERDARRFSKKKEHNTQSKMDAVSLALCRIKQHAGLVDAVGEELKTGGGRPATVSYTRRHTVDATAISTPTSLLPWLLSELALHGYTFLGLLLVLIGFLYLSYDLLGKPGGILRLFLVVFTHLAVSLFVLAACAPLMLFLSRQALGPTNAPVALRAFGQQFADTIVYTLMVAVLQGTLIALPPPRRPVKRVAWRDAAIGLLFGVVFFCIDEFLVFHTALIDVPDILLDGFFFVCLGVVGAGFWSRYGQSLRSLPRQEGSLPSVFALTDFIRGLLFWYIVGVLSILLWVVLYLRVYHIAENFLFYLVDLLIGIAAAGLVCGSSQYITWRVYRLDEKQLGIIGALVTLLGFALGLIEPLVLFLRTP